MIDLKMYLSSGAVTHSLVPASQAGFASFLFYMIQNSIFWGFRQTKHVTAYYRL